MYASYDMNPVAIRKMQRERLSADIDCVERPSGAWFRTGAAIFAALVFAAVLL